MIILTTILATSLVILLYSNLRNPQKELEYVIEKPVSVDDPLFSKRIGDLLNPKFIDGNKIETLANGEEIFPSMLAAIRSAQKTICFESYIYWSGKTGESFAQALAERARAGVKVHVLLDWLGSGKIDDHIIEVMEKGGVEIQRFHAPRWYNISRMNNRTHRKVLVIDGKIGFTGGVGIADEWTGNGTHPKHWRDTHFRVEGPVVNQMQSAFMDNWLKTHANVLTDERYFPELKPAGTIRAQMFISSSEEGGASVRILYLMAIAAAKKTLYLESAYFVPDEHTIEQLVAAQLRGVDVTIVVPGEYTDSHVVDAATKELWGKLLKSGVKMYRYQPAMFHCKILVVDGYFSSVGSTNFDNRSFRLNDEANLNVLDREFAEEQMTLIRQDIGRSKLVTYEEWENRPMSEKIKGKITSIVQSQL